MQLLQIQIERTYAQIGLNVKKPVQEIEQPMAELNLRQEPAILEIKQAKGHFSIDSTRARESIGLRTSVQFSNENANYGKQKLLEAIGKMSEEGDNLAAIERRGNAIAQIAVDKIGTEHTPLASPSGPDEGVDVNYQPIPLEIHVERRGMKMDPVRNAPVLQYTPGKVEPYMLRWPSLSINVVGLHVDRSI